jgi:hypothetical protein
MLLPAATIHCEGIHGTYEDMTTGLLSPEAVLVSFGRFGASASAHEGMLFWI